MIRTASAALGLAVALAAFAGWRAIAPPSPLPARFSAADCTVLFPNLRGAEDLAALPSGALLASAHDRRAVQGRPPDGGLFLLDPAQGAIRSLVDPAAFPLGFRPHGIAVDGGRVAVINRGARRADEGWSRAVTIELFAWRGDRLKALGALADPAPCATNDLAFDGPERLLATVDQTACPPPLWETVFSGGGALLSFGLGDGAPLRVAEGLSFANGVAATSLGWRVAETRGNRVQGPQGTTALPGGPDNLTVDGAGLVAALHPNLLRLALHRAGWIGAAPSRIVRLEDARVEVLFDDPRGAVYSGATVGVLAGDTLYAGSATGSGVLRCRAGGGSTARSEG